MSEVWQIVAMTWYVYLQARLVSVTEDPEYFRKVEDLVKANGTYQMETSSRKQYFLKAAL